MQRKDTKPLQPEGTLSSTLTYVRQPVDPPRYSPPRHPTGHIVREVITVLHDQMVAIPCVFIRCRLDKPPELAGRHARCAHLNAFPKYESGCIFGLYFEHTARRIVMRPVCILRPMR